MVFVSRKTNIYLLLLSLLLVAHRTRLINERAELEESKYETRSIVDALPASFDNNYHFEVTIRGYSSTRFVSRERMGSMMRRMVNHSSPEEEEEVRLVRNSSREH